MLRKAERFVRVVFLSSVLYVGSFQVVEDSLAQLEKCIQMASRRFRATGGACLRWETVRDGFGAVKRELKFPGPNA